MTRLVFLLSVLTSTVLAQTDVCDPGKWGPNCDQECHCLGGDFKCDQKTANCVSNVCQAGYLNPPKCQTACEAGKFGDGCELTCHCVNDEVCNNVNGYCANGCSEMYTGAGCLKRRTFLGTPPSAINVTCSSLRVTWPAWSASEAVDVSDIFKPIQAYQLQMRINDSAWSDLGAYRTHVTNQADYFYTLNNLQKYTKYVFRVRADGQSEWQKPVRGFPGPASRPAYAQCTAPTQRPTDSPTAPGPVLDPAVAVIAVGKIRVSWKAPGGTTAVTGYELRYKKLGIGEDGGCEALLQAPTTTLTLAVETTTRDLEALAAWTYYQIQIVAQNAVGDGQLTTLTANTLETTPLGEVTGLTSSDVTQTELTLQWTALPCSQRRGTLTKYVIQITPNGGQARTIETTNANRVIVRDLTASTRYSLRVQFVNQHGATPFSDALVVTTAAQPVTEPPETVPSAPRQVQVVPRTSSMYVSWLPPNPTNGAIIEYQLSYRVAGSVPFTSLNTAQREMNVTGLTTGANYNVKVRARNADGWGPYSGVTTVVLPTQSLLPSQPSTPQLVDSSLRTPVLRWREPTVTHGGILDYKVIYLRTDTEAATPAVARGEKTVTTTSVTLDNLDPASTYSVTVTPRNANGAGTPSTPADIVTYPPIPADPSAPQFAMDAQTDTTALVKIYTVSSPNVALVDVYVMIVTSKRRRKRANADCTANGRHQLRILQEDFVSNEKEIVIGDGSTKNGIANVQLNPQTKYEVCSKVVSVYKNRQSYSYAKGSDWIITREPTVLAAGVDWWIILIIIIILLILIVLIVIIVLCILLRRKKKKSQNLDKTWLNYYTNNYERFDDSSPKIQPYGRWSDITDFSQPRHVEHMREAMEPVDPETKTIEQEYKHLPQDQLHPWLQALKPENDVKNRFQQFLPYDHTRVNLRGFDGDNLYVNANYIDGFQKPKAYIAAQSPFNTDTVHDFWEMIYQENCQQVIMLCKSIEDGILKCEPYWPDSSTRVYRHLAVTLKTTDTFTNYVIRHFDLTPQKHFTKTKTVLQYQYTAWPAHGTPKDPIPYLEFVLKIRAQGMPGSGPQLVHCGTGVSRTAVHIGVDSLMKEGLKTGKVGVFNFCKDMRHQRISMVRTPLQYNFIYDTLFEALMTSNYIMDFEMRQTYKRLLEKNNRTGRTELLEQFKILRYYTPQLNEDHCKAALRSQNRGKNRYLNILPPDDIRVTIRTPGGVERNDYINAIFIDGHTRPKSFVVTQTPMLGTCIDFWKLIYDHKIKTIVMLHDKTYKDDTLEEYWPKGDEMKRYDPFFVSLKSSVKEKDFVVKRYFDLSSGHQRNEKSREVKQFQLFSGWHMYDKVPDRDALLQLVDSVLDEQRRTEEDDGKETEHAPILIHCADGATRSGLFCSLMLLIEKMKTDRYVDIFHTVKHLKRQRPQFVDDFEQYKMCFKALWEHVNTRFKSTYSLSRESKGSMEGLDTVDATKESMLR